MVWLMAFHPEPGAGWFPDQADLALERWFDGVKWTGATRHNEARATLTSLDVEDDLDDEYLEDMAYLVAAHRRGTRIRGWVTIALLVAIGGTVTAAGMTNTETWVCFGRAIDCLSVQETTLSSFFNGLTGILSLAAVIIGWKWAARKLSE